MQLKCPVGITPGAIPKRGGRPARWSEQAAEPQDSVSTLSTGPGLSRIPYWAASFPYPPSPAFAESVTSARFESEKDSLNVTKDTPAAFALP